MRNYELAFIIAPNQTDDGVTSIIDRVSQMIQAVDGKVASVNVWGRRTLAYPIEQYKEGTYVLFNTEMSPATLIDFERNLKLTEEVIRYLLIKADN